MGNALWKRRHDKIVMLKKHFYILFACLVSLFAVEAKAQDPWGLANDVPTWQPGDQWSFRRTFTIALNGILAEDVGFPGFDLWIDANLYFTDDFTLQVTGEAVVNNGLHGFQNTLAYNRTRTAGTLSVTGAGSLTLYVNDVRSTENVNLLFSLPSANSSTGTNWTAVADLAQIRENFSFPDTTVVNGLSITTGTPNLCATLPAVGLSCGNSFTYTLGANLNIDHAAVDTQYGALSTTGGLEVMDFPTIDPFQDNGSGEKWSQFVQRGVNGSLHLIQTNIPIDQLVVINEAVPLLQLNTLQSLTATDPNSLFANNRRVQGQSPNPSANDDAYYTPTAKEFSYFKMGNVSVSSGLLTVGVNNFTTRLLNSGSFTLAPDGDIVNLAITPPRPGAGQPFTVTGLAPLGTNITGTVLLPGGGGSSANVGVTLGAFSIPLVAPTKRDSTRSQATSTEKEIASFGIQLVRDGLAVPYNKKSLTLRLDVITPVRDWSMFE